MRSTEYNMNNNPFNKITLTGDYFFHFERTKGLIYIHEIDPQ